MENKCNIHFKCAGIQHAEIFGVTLVVDNSSYVDDKEPYGDLKDNILTAKGDVIDEK